jgi:hypothetical protein
MNSVPLSWLLSWVFSQASCSSLYIHFKWSLHESEIQVSVYLLYSIPVTAKLQSMKYLPISRDMLLSQTLCVWKIKCNGGNCVCQYYFKANSQHDKASNNNRTALLQKNISCSLSQLKIKLLLLSEKLHSSSWWTYICNFHKWKAMENMM